uniref:Uncharacterized protein n=1 Tax=Candidatus Kentrum sp. SD TaxID=2126332 RepID=A0A450YIK6_9GAMM|nr:MAG: hypothetical protein BECKSD772F_GA0070984_109113 [Candidatus Kentron sp. SD]VFK47204.1 MAG: hypothetical protein BECKSD772E_GA0070983_108913 [Candidatus Kentron sp. SD]
MIKKSENLKNVVFYRPFWFRIFRVGMLRRRSKHSRNEPNHAIEPQRHHDEIPELAGRDRVLSPGNFGQRAERARIDEHRQASCCKQANTANSSRK